MQYGHSCRIGIMVLLTALSAGCAAHLQTRTVEASDTYDAWAARLDHMPFVFHRPDGHVDVYDVHGEPWIGAAEDVEKGAGQRVEVYEGSFGAPSASVCSPFMSAAHAGDVKDSANVEAAICDRERTVVSFSDKVRNRVLESKAAYVPRVRHLLLEGIWESVAQEPAPLHS